MKLKNFIYRHILLIVLVINLSIWGITCFYINEIIGFVNSISFEMLGTLVSGVFLILLMFLWWRV